MSDSEPLFERDADADIYTVPMRLTAQMMELLWQGVDCNAVSLRIVDGREATLRFSHGKLRGRARLFNRLAKGLGR